MRGRGIRRRSSCLPSAVIDLSQTYRHLRAWNQDELAVRYATANRRGQQLLRQAPGTVPERAIALLATAIPSAATLSVAIHLVHALPDGPRAKLADELLATAETNAADALHRCHRALEHDGHATATPPTNGSRSSSNQRRRCSSPAAWTRSHRRSSGRPRRRCAGCQPRSPA